MWQTLDKNDVIRRLNTNERKGELYEVYSYLLCSTQ